MAKARLTEAKKDALLTYWKENPTAKGQEVADAMKVSVPTANTYKKKAGLTKSRNGGTTNNKLTVNKDALFALRMGSVSKAISALKKIDEDEAVSYCIASGGKEKAIQRMQDLEVLLKLE